MRLFYASSSFEDMRHANFIQVRNMALAFAAIGDVTLVLKEGPDKRDWPRNITVKRFRAKRGRFANLYYGLQAFNEYKREAKSFDCVYSRNVLFSLLCGSEHCTTVHGFEFHTFVEGLSYKVIQKQLIRRSDICVAISQSLKDRIEQLIPRAEHRMFVFHDAHANSVVPRIRAGTYIPPKVGYFGSINDLKGECILREIIQKGSDFRFHIYSPDLDRLKKHPNLAEYRYLPHEKVFDKMAEMDFLLLITKPQSTNRDITPYTSPLKLFEYMSVAGVVLASRTPSVEEIIHHGENGYLVGNTFEEWIYALRDLARNRELYQRISSGAIETAARHTWKSRAQQIIRIMTATDVL